MSIIREEIRDGVVVLTFDDRDAKVNTLNQQTLGDLAARLKAIHADPGKWQGVVLASSKPGFVAGANLREVQTMRSPDDARQQLDLVGEVGRLIETCPVTVVAAVNGTAVGGGFELALACHGRVGTPAVRLGLPELDLGLMPGAGGTQRLPRLIGLAPAIEVVLNGRMLSAGEARDLGILAEIVDPEHLVDAAAALARRLAPRQPWDAPGWQADPPPGSDAAGALFDAAEARARKRMGEGDIAEAEIIAVMREGWALPLPEALKREVDGFAKLGASATAKNRIRTGFFGPLALRAMKSRPAGFAPTTFTRIAVIGGGLMGSGIAWVAAQNGVSVAIVEADAAGAARTEKALDRIGARLVKRGGEAAAGKVAQARACITVHAEWPDLSDCQAAIEAVSEVVEVKATIFARLVEAMPADALIASNTSTMAITGLAGHVARPERFIGMHFFSPVERMQLLEIIIGRETSDRALAMAMDLARAMRKLPIVVKDGPGFFTSRIVSTYTGEALTLLAEGVDPVAIDRAALAFGMPIGPLAMVDTVGIGLLRDIYRALAAAGSPVIEGGSRGLEALEALYDAGRRARPDSGIFAYGDDGRASGAWDGLAGLFPATGPAPDAATIKRRLFHVQALESMRALEDGIISDVTEVDVASTLGWAFPKSMGGVLSYVDTVGPARFLAEAEVLAAEHGTRFAPPQMLRDMVAQGRRFHEV